MIDNDDQGFYSKMNVPFPTLCPACRAQRRLAFRNDRALFKRISDFSGKEIFSAFSPESSVKVYENDIYFSDKWDPMEYGREVDFSRPFLEQVHELMLEVPFKSLNVIGGTNSEYTNNISNPKNCYLVFNATNPEDGLYSHGLNFSRECMDVSHVSKSELCYESFWLTSCTRAFFSSQCENSFDIWFSKNLSGCSECIGCVGLRKKTNYIFNQPYSKEDYAEKIKSFHLDTYEGIKDAKKLTHAFWKKFPNKNLEGLQNTNVSGNYIANSKDVRDSFLVREGENIRYCQYLQELPGCKDCYDYSVWGDGAQMMYECVSCGCESQNIKFSFLTQENVHDIEYSIACSNGSAYLFGCVGLRKKQYCILNREYSKEEYMELVPKIIEHMKAMPYKAKNGQMYSYGEFFPVEFSPFAYNETLAQEYFPLSVDEAASKGFVWHNVSTRDYKFTKEVCDLPNTITSVDNKIVNEIIHCAHASSCGHGCTGAFKIVPNELTLYRKMNIPLPHLCPNCRTEERLENRQGMILREAKCDCNGGASLNKEYKNTFTHSHGDTPCGETFQTTYKKDPDTIIYCKLCYQQEFL